MKKRTIIHPAIFASIVDDLSVGSFVPGPAIIAEDETTTIVPKAFAARLSPIGAILLEKV